MNRINENGLVENENSLSNSVSNFQSKEKIEWYIGFAEQASKKSPDLETKVGGCLVNKSTGAVLSIGFNGFVRRAPDNKLPRTRPEKYEYMIHSEKNLIYNCAKHGISMDNCEVYLTTSPCKDCLRALWQCGISRIYFKNIHPTLNETLAIEDLFIKCFSLGEYNVLEVVENV